MESYKTKDNNAILKDLFLKKKGNKLKRLGKVFNTELNNYFYDMGTGKVILMDDQVYRIFALLFNDSKYSEDEFWDNINKISIKAVQEFIEVVKNEELFQAPEISRLYTPSHYENLEKKINSDFNQLILELTGKCNLRCGYCIYNDEYKYNRSFNNSDMTQEIAKKAIVYAKEHSGKEVAITFYGGEPLVRFELLKWCIEYSEKIMKEKEVSYSLTTNLTLVTEEIAEYLASVPSLNILCSLDGPAEVQNKYRRFANGGGTFSKAIRGLKILVEAFKAKKDGRISINAVLAPPYTYEKIEEINKFFEELTWLPDDTNISIQYVADGSVDEDEHLKDLYNNPKYREGLKKGVNPLFTLEKRYIKNNESIRQDKKNIYSDRIEKALLKIHKRLIFNKPYDVVTFNGCCVPGVRRLYVSTEGKFYPCERIGLSPSIGDVDNGIDINKVRKHYIKEYSDKSVEDCSNCWAARMCDICYVGCYTEEGLNCELKKGLCVNQRETLEQLMVAYHAIMEDNPEKLDYLNNIEIN